MSVFKRLNELTAIQNDFEDEVTSGDHGRPHRGSRRARLQDGLSQVNAARGDEIARLSSEGCPLQDIAAQLDHTDRNRNR